MLRKLVTLFTLIQPLYLFCFQQVDFIKSDDQTTPTLINSVSFHPKKNLFCATFTHQQWVGVYQVSEGGHVERVQILKNPEAGFFHPQNAIFSPDGNNLVVVNWSSRNFNVYPVNAEGTIQPFPQCAITTELAHEKYRPHGMCFSADGNYLAVVYGSFQDSPWTVILYRVSALGTPEAKLIPCGSIQKNQLVQGTPKGVAFSPDESCVVITFTKTDSIAIFPVDLDKGWISPVPTQEISGRATQLCRPEDIAFAPDGTYCAVSNSSKDTVTFYSFDKEKNRFSTPIPFKKLNRANAGLHFPHGLAFSSDGKYFAVTQFGLVKLDPLGHLTTWGKKRVEGVSLFKVDN